MTSVVELKILYLRKKGETSSRHVSVMKELLRSEQFEIILPNTLTAEGVRELIEDVDFLIVGLVPPGQKIGAETFEHARNLKLIQMLDTRVDNIDVAAARRAGIAVAIIPSSAKYVAEHAVLLMLALSKNLINAHNAVVSAQYLSLGLEPEQTTQWDFSTEWKKVVELATSGIFGKSLGIVGTGQVGKEVAKRATCLGMKVLYYDINKLDPEEAEMLNVEYRSLHELLSECDFVTLHIPHTEKTEGMIGKREFSLMKSTAFLINTSRGGVIDEDALVNALKNKHIAGAGLDVFREEPVSKDNELLKLDNVILTPHFAGGKSFSDSLETVCRNILQIARGQERIT